MESIIIHLLLRTIFLSTVRKDMVRKAKNKESRTKIWNKEYRVKITDIRWHNSLIHKSLIRSLMSSLARVFSRIRKGVLSF